MHHYIYCSYNGTLILGKYSMKIIFDGRQIEIVVLKPTTFINTMILVVDYFTNTTVGTSISALMFFVQSNMPNILIIWTLA